MGKSHHQPQIALRMITGYHFICHERWLRDTVFHQFIYHTYLSPDFKIFFAIKKNGIECYLSANYFGEPVQLFRLDLLFPTHKKGFLTDQLYQLKKSGRFLIPDALRPSFHEQVNHSPFTFAGQKRVGSNDEPIFSDLKGHGLQKEGFEICFSTLLLDFLFDLFHSPVFKQSTNYHIVHKAIHSNRVFRSIFLKANAYYRTKVYQEIPNAISKMHAKSAIYLWLNTTNDENYAITLVESPWFATDMAREQKEIFELCHIVGIDPSNEIDPPSITPPE